MAKSKPRPAARCYVASRHHRHVGISARPDNWRTCFSCEVNCRYVSWLHVLWQMNAVNRLIYESSQKSKPRTTQFHVVREGTINMAMSSAAERDQRDEIKLKRQLSKAEQEGMHCQVD